MDERLTDQEDPTEFDFGSGLSRRQFLSRGLATAGIVTAGLRISEHFGVDAENDDPMDHEPTFSFPDAEMVRDILENEGFEGLMQYFRIATAEYPSESDFGVALAERVRAWIMADCIAMHEGSSTQEISADEQPEDIIGLAAVMALSGEAVVEQADGDLSQIPLYQKIDPIRQELHRVYVSEMGDVDTAPEVETVVVRNEMTGQDAGRHQFQRAVVLEYTIRGKEVLLIIDGALNLDIDPSSGVYELTLDSTNPTPPFTLTHG